MEATDVKQTIAGALGKALAELKLLAGGDVPDFEISHPKDEKNGDYSTNIALLLAKRVGHNPRELADKIASVLQNDVEMNRLIRKVEVAGAGFINFYLKPEWLAAEAEKAIEKDFGKNGKYRGKLAIVEYSSPNIAKPFTVGHLRSTIIGDAVANLLEMNGWKVLRDNHLGDWGTQFGKQIAAIKHWGDIEAIGKSENPVKELVALYVKFHEEAEKDSALDDEARAWFKKLEDGDPEARQLWQMCVDWSWKEFARIYDLLGVHHSPEFQGGRGLGEAFFEDKMGTVIELLKKKKMLKEGKEGAQLVFFPGDKYPPAMILKKDGATLYHTRDLATDKYRLETYHPDLIINEVGAEQQLYFQQLYEMEQMLGWYGPGQRVHVMHGMYRFAEGKMSTRRGNVVWLEEVLDEAIKRAGELGKGNEKVAEAVGIGALKWNDLKGEARRDIVFDWDQILSMQGDSGPYIQYTYARARSVLQKAVDARVKPSQMQGFNPSNLNTEELSILRWLYRYPEVIAEAGRVYAPHLVASYLYELAGRFNTFYNKHQILAKQESEIQDSRFKIQEQFRVLLTRAVANVLASGLSVLGIAAPEEM